MLSLTSEYALRAMIFLAGHVDECPVAGRTIAKEARIPRQYLSSILGDLVKEGLLEATPGKGGGFSMVRSPREITFAHVLAPFEPSIKKRRSCPFGNGECSDANPCLGHERWNALLDSFTCFLEETSVYDVVVKRGPDGKPRP